MDIHARHFIHTLILSVGFVNIIAGIALGMPSASIIGLIVAAINIHSLQKVNRQ